MQRDHQIPNDKTVGGGDDTFNTFFSETSGESDDDCHRARWVRIGRKKMQSSSLEVTASPTQQKALIDHWSVDIFAVRTSHRC